MTKRLEIFLIVLSLFSTFTFSKHFLVKVYQNGADENGVDEEVEDEIEVEEDKVEGEEGTGENSGPQLNRMPPPPSPQMPRQKKIGEVWPGGVPPPVGQGGQGMPSPDGQGGQGMPSPGGGGQGMPSPGGQGGQMPPQG